MIFSAKDFGPTIYKDFVNIVNKNGWEEACKKTDLKQYYKIVENICDYHCIKDWENLSQHDKEVQTCANTVAQDILENGVRQILTEKDLEIERLDNRILAVMEMLNTSALKEAQWKDFSISLISGSKLARVVLVRKKKNYCRIEMVMTNEEDFDLNYYYCIEGIEDKNFEIFDKLFVVTYFYLCHLPSFMFAYNSLKKKIAKQIMDRYAHTKQNFFKVLYLKVKTYFKKSTTRVIRKTKGKKNESSN